MSDDGILLGILLVLVGLAASCGGGAPPGVY